MIARSPCISRVPFFAAAVFTALNFTIALFVLRETLSESNRRAFALRRANVFGALRSLRVIPGALLLLCTLFMYQIGHDTLPSSWAWVTMGKFGWGEREVGLSLAVLGLGTAVVQGGLVGLFTKKFGERRAALIGLCGGACGFLGYAFSTTPAMLFASVPLACLIGLTMPSIRAILSRAVPANAQGELQGAVQSIGSIAAIIGPPLYTQALARFSGPNAIIDLPGMPMLISAGISLITLGLFLKGASLLKREG